MLERFTKRNCNKQIKKSLDLKKELKEKAINYVLNGKATIILLTVGLIKRQSINEWIFSKTKISKSESNLNLIKRANLKIESKLSNYATKADLKNVTGADTSEFDKKNLIYLI